MFSKDFARTVIGIIGNIISLVLYLSPVTTFHYIWKKKAVEQYSAIPYLSSLMNCGVWVLYGLPMVKPHSTPIVTINSLGFVIEIIYISIFFGFARKKERLRLVAILVLECVFLAALPGLVLTLAQTIKLRSSIIGSICIAGSILMYASPLSVMKLVITTRNVEYMPFFLSLFTFLNGACWACYGIIRFDPFIVAPNAVGVLLGLIQLLVYAMFYKSTVKTNAKNDVAPEVGMGAENSSC